jgi:oxygen-dependent protoporphyrinogen oxidase
VRRIAERVAGRPWLAVAGNAYAGVGVPDCIRSGQAAADRVLGVLGGATGRASDASAAPLAA